MNTPIFVTKPTPTAQAAEAALRAALTGTTALPAGLVFAIGGDGTMLHAIRQHLEGDVMFVGISAGRLGFLQTVEPDEIPQLVQALRLHTFSVIKTPLLAASQGGRHLGYAFNDISLERGGPRAAKFDLHIGGSSGSFIGDGVIFATPMGSTAYNLAAGGPIIDSAAQDLFVVTPNNPHISTLYSSLQRPHVLTRRRRVSIAIDPADATERPVTLMIDGLAIVPKAGEPIEIYLSDHFIQLVELTPDGFHNRVENKRLGRF
ncbi:MAG TPA: NAD(+)/NADH kinase [Candidatus Saccharimonas sp.]|nr:NAD(+)/NADH kinase [Candidatus Saccharimonas sp.]